MQPLESIIFYYKYCYKLEIYETVHSGMVLSSDKCISFRKWEDPAAAKAAGQNACGVLGRNQMCVKMHARSRRNIK